MWTLGPQQQIFSLRSLSVGCIYAYAQIKLLLESSSFNFENFFENISTQSLVSVLPSFLMWFWMIDNLKLSRRRKTNLRKILQFFFYLYFATDLQDTGKKSVEKYKIKVTLFSSKYLSDIFDGIWSETYRYTLIRYCLEEKTLDNEIVFPSTGTIYIPIELHDIPHKNRSLQRQMLL